MIWGHNQEYMQMQKRTFTDQLWVKTDKTEKRFNVRWEEKLKRSVSQRQQESVIKALSSDSTRQNND